MVPTTRMVNDIARQNQGRVLLHCCCAPCASSIIERLALEQVEFSIFFYNPNIHPETEYQLRKREILKYAASMNISCIDAEYDVHRWMAHVKGFEKEPERGARCSLCFAFRLVKTAEYASQHGFSAISTTLGISRRKDFDQVTRAGREAAALFPGIAYIDRNWRKGGGVQRMAEIMKEQQLYRQTYCGCCYSMPKSG